MTAPAAGAAGSAPASRRLLQIVGVVWFTLAVTYGLFFSFSIFFVPLLEEFHWSRALTAGALSLSTVLQGVLAPVAGIAVDRLGPRRVILAGVVVLAASSILTATVRAPWQLYLYTGVLGGCGVVALGWVPMSVLLSRWVAERRGRVVGLAFSGMGIGVFVTGPLAQWLIASLGWRAASAVLGAGALAVLLPVTWRFAQDAPPRPVASGDAAAARARAPASPHPSPPARRDPTVADAVRTPAFWALFAAYFLTPLAVFPVFTHQVAFAVDLGFPRLLVASVFGFMGLMSSVGRPIFGVAADRFGGAMSATISYACTAAGALALVALEARPRTEWLVVYAVLFGLGFGARGPIITAIASDLFGGRRFGAIYGVLNLSNGLGAAIGPWFGGAVHDVTGSYRLAFVSSVLFSALGSVCFWLARRRAP
jgi:MFS family permease